MSDLFSPDVLAKSVHDTLEEALTAIPPGNRRALLFDAATDTHTVRALYVERVGDDWQIALQGAYDGQHVAGKVTVAHAWR